MLKLKGRKMKEQAQRIKRLHGLIKRKGTGNAQRCADYMGISRRHFYRLLDLMRELDAPIVYDKHINSYVYTYEVECQFGFTPVKKS